MYSESNNAVSQTIDKMLNYVKLILVMFHQETVSGLLMVLDWCPTRRNAISTGYN